jgi:hypothetical protein
MPRDEKTHAKKSKLLRYVPSWEADEESWRVEGWIIGRLVALGAARLGEITTGSTTFAIRRERIRRAIVAAGFEATHIGIVGKTQKTHETFGSIFVRFYREPLIPTLEELPVCSNSSDERPP